MKVFIPNIFIFESFFSKFVITNYNIKMKTKLLFIAVAFILIFNVNLDAQTVQSRTFTFTEASQASTYNGNSQHVLAVWIEQGTGTPGTFIVTKFRYVGAVTSDHLPTWASKASAAVTTTATSASCNVATATTGATLAAWSTKTVTWDGKDASGLLVADGNYQFVIQSTWNHGTTGTVSRYFPFVKGPNAINPSYVDDSNFTSITAILANPEFSVKPEVIIYPNPTTTGNFFMEFKNDVNKIRIINILGKVVYSEKVTSDYAATTKRIDLSNLVNGLYIVSVTNENGTSNYKVVLNK